MALKADSSLWACGYGGDGRLGDGTNNTEQNTPVRVGAAVGWKAVSSGEYHTMAIEANGCLWAWGSNNTGQLGNGANAQRNSPVRVGEELDWVAVSAGSLHTIAIKADGSLWAWGRTEFRPLADRVDTDRNVPVRVGTGFRLPKRHWN
jgi:alpha-tubulin suppressor-like RCC1 family protein